MRQIAIVGGACLMMLILAGCAKPAPEEKFLSHWEKIVTILSENKQDKALAAAAVKKYLADNLAEMKELHGRFGGEESKNIASDSYFLQRVMKLVDEIAVLQNTYQPLLEDPAVNEALAPFSELTVVP